MNGDLVPAITAAAGGASLMGTIIAIEKKRDQEMKASRVRLALTFPAKLDALHAKAALAALAGGDWREEFVFSVEASASGTRHYIHVPAALRTSVVAALSAAMPGLRAVEAPAPPGRTMLATRVFFPTPLALATSDPESAARTLLAGVAGLARSEQAILRVAARPGLPRNWSPSDPPDRRAREAERHWRQKVTTGAGFEVSALILVRAATVARAREILAHLESSVRSRRGPVGAVKLTTDHGSRSLAAEPRVTRSAGWLTPTELLGSLLAWPLGDEPMPGVEVGGSRELAVPSHVPREGRQLLIGRDSRGNDRPVALTEESLRLHLALLGSTGSGKTTTITRLILDALATGIGGVYLDPKDGAALLIERVPRELAERVVVLDLAQPGPIPGLDLFGAGDPVLRSDVILSVLKGMSDSWGVRVDRFLRIGLRSVQALPDPVLADWLRLYADPAFRRSVTARVTDPVLAAEWRAYEALSPAEQHAFVAPATGRVTDLLSRPALRAAISQPEPKLSISRLLAEGKWLVVALSPGTLGEAAAGLLAGIVSYLVWSTIEQRAAIPEEQRQQVMFVLDELQSLTHLPIGVDVFFARLRSLNCAVVAATQSAARLPEALRQSLLANVGSMLVWRSGADEAARLARELPPLTATDLMSLARHEVAARISTADVGRGSVVVTGRTEPLPPTTGMGSVIRQLSAECYGREPAEIEKALRERAAEEDNGSGGFGRTGRAA
jgi:hypothetical protein